MISAFLNPRIIVMMLPNQYDIEAWESDTRYNFDISLEFERIQAGLQEVKQFLDVNHMSYTLTPELTAEMKEKLRTKLPKSLDIRDDFEWNCYYTIFKKQISVE